MIKLPLELVRVYEVLFKFLVRNINFPLETATFDYFSLQIILIYQAEPWQTDCMHGAALLLCDPFLSSKVHRLILSLCLFLIWGGGCEVTALGVRVAAPTWNRSMAGWGGAAPPGAPWGGAAWRRTGRRPCTGRSQRSSAGGEKMSHSNTSKSNNGWQTKNLKTTQSSVGLVILAH